MPLDQRTRSHRAAAAHCGALVACAAALLIALPTVAVPAAAGAETKASNPTAQQIKKFKRKAIKKVTKAVTKELPVDPTPGLEPPDSQPAIKVVSCKQKKKRGNFAGFKCAWNAHGELPGVVPFKCKGEATVNKNGKRVKRLDPCENAEEVQAPLLATPHDIAFGYIEDFLTYTDLWDDLAASGADTVEHQLAWDVLQPNPGSPPSSWNWAPYDGLYNQSLAAGTRPIWTFLDAPCWAAPPGCDPTRPINAIDASKVGDYAAAAAEVAKRYPQSRAIEVWLEPNGQFWGAAPPNPKLFSELVGATANAVHATGTGVPVYSGGLAPGAADPSKQEFASFLSDALAAGGIENADAIAFHAVADVPFKPPNDPTVGYLGRMRVQIQDLRSELAADGLATPIAITEFAYSTSGPDSYTESQQADALVSSYEVLRRTPGVPTAIASRLLDNGDGSKVSGFGVLKPNRSKKPAYCQLAAARGVATPPGC